MQVGDGLVGVASRALGLHGAIAQGGSEGTDLLEDRGDPLGAGVGLGHRGRLLQVGGHRAGTIGSWM